MEAVMATAMETNERARESAETWTIRQICRRDFI
jgi:hypothetical protein